MESLFSLYWWCLYFLSIISLSFANFRSVHKSFKTLRVAGSIGIIFFVSTVLLAYINWGLFSVFLLLFYNAITVLFKQRLLHPYLRNYIPQHLKPIYDHFMIGKSNIDEDSVRKSLNKELKRKVSEYIDSF